MLCLTLPPPLPFFFFRQGNASDTVVSVPSHGFPLHIVSIVRPGLLDALKDILYNLQKQQNVSIVNI